MRKVFNLITLICAVLFNFSITNAQPHILSSYSFSQNSVTYTPITGGTVYDTGFYVSDQRFAATLPFSFIIDGVSYSQISVCDNGYIGFSNNDPGMTNYFPIGSTSTGFGIAAPFASDLQGYSGNGCEVRSQTIGSAPNRTFVVQWKNVSRTSSSQLFNFQVRLNETVNTIDFVYGSMTNTASFVVQVGLRGTSNAYYNSRTGSSGWSLTNNSTVSSATVSVSSALLPSSGLKFTFTPPQCATPVNQPTSLILTPSFNSISGSFTAASPVVDKYLIVVTPGVALSGTPSNGTYYTTGNSIGNGTVLYAGPLTTFTHNSLSMNTNYTYTVFAYDDTCSTQPIYKTNNPLTGNATTLGPHRYIWVPASGSADWQVSTNWSPARTQPHVDDTLVFNNGGTISAINIPNQSVEIMEVTNNTQLTLNSASNNTLTLDSILFPTGSAITLGPNTTNLTIYTKPSQLNGTITVTGSSALSTQNTASVVNGNITVKDLATYRYTNGTTIINGSVVIKNKGLYNATNGNTTINGTLTLSDSAVFKSTNATGTTVTLANTSIINIGDSSTFDAASTITTVNGTINVQGLKGLMKGCSGCLTFNSNSVYNHNRNGGSIPQAAYNTASTINITGITNTSFTVTAPQRVGNFVWNCSAQNTGIIIPSGIDSVKGNMTVTNTGSYILRSGTHLKVIGNFSQYSGTYQIGSTSTLRVFGNVLLVGGTVDLNSNSNDINSLSVYGDLTQNSGHYITKSGNGKPNIEFVGTVSQKVNIAGTLAPIPINYILNNKAGAVLTGVLPIRANAYNSINAGSWTGSGSFMYDSFSSLNYNVDYEQTITPIEWPANSSPYSVYISMGGNAPNNRLWLSGSRSVPGTLTIYNGVLCLGDYNLTVNHVSIQGGIVDSNKMIAADGNGYLYKVIDSASTLRQFRCDIGDITGIQQVSPFVLTLAGGGTRKIGVRVRDMKHPDNTATTSYIDRYWEVVDSGSAASFGYKVEAQFPFVDVVGKADVALSHWDGTSWLQMPGYFKTHVPYWNLYGIVPTDTISSANRSLNGAHFTCMPNTHHVYSWTGAVSTDFTNPANWNPNRNSTKGSDILQFNSGNTDSVKNIPNQTVTSLIVTNNTTAVFQCETTGSSNVITLGLNSDNDTSTYEIRVDSGSTLLNISNGTTKEFYISLSGDSCRGLIAGRAEVFGTTGIGRMHLASPNGRTIVTSSGILAAGGSSPQTSISCDSNSVYIYGIYEHKFSMGTNNLFPIAKWMDGSKAIIKSAWIGMNPDIIGLQSFYHLEYDCPTQTAVSIMIPPNVRDTFKVVSTGTGELQFGIHGTFNRTIRHYVQTGGTVNTTSYNGTTSQTYNITGSFIQSGGIFKCTGANSTPLLNFAGNNTQTFSVKDSSLGGAFIYQISNPNGINLIGTGSISVFNVRSPGAIRISVPNSSPINTTLPIAYNAGANLIFDGQGSYAADTIVYPATNQPTNLTVAIGTGNVLRLPGNRVVPGTFQMTSGDLDISTYSLMLGTSAASQGTLVWTAGSNIRLTSGSVTRWYGTTGLPTAPGNAIGFYPIAYNGAPRHVSLYFSTTTALSVGGSITVSHNHINGQATGLSIADGVYTINNRTNASWSFATGGGLTLTSATMGLRVAAADLVSFIPTVADLRLMRTSSVVGTHVAGSGSSPSYMVQRSGLTDTALTNASLYVGTSSANMPTAFISVNDGSWNNPATWNINAVPGINDLVQIRSGDTVMIDTACFAKMLVVSNAGAIHANDSTLKVDSLIDNFGHIRIAGGTVTLGPTGGGKCPFRSNGTLTVASGNLNINGYLKLENGSVFNQSGGNINLDGNAGGVLANSVPNGFDILDFGTSNLNVTNGNITIIDPHAGTSRVFNMSATSGNTSFGPAHNLIFGDGISTAIGGTSDGFRFSTSSSSRILLGNVIINGSGSTSIAGRKVTQGSLHVIIKGNLTINPYGEYNNTGSNVYIKGNVTVGTGAKFNTTGTIYFTDYANNTQVTNTQTQLVSGTGTIVHGTISNFQSIVINNSSPGGVVFDVGDVSFVGLTLTKGRLFMANGSTLINSAPAPNIQNASQSTGWVVGKIQWPVAIGAYNIKFDLGDSLNYTKINMSGVASTAGALKVSFVNNDHPNISTSGIFVNKSVNKYYVVDTIGTISFSATNKLGLSWSAADIDAGAIYPNFVAKYYKNAAWSHTTDSVKYATQVYSSVPANTFPAVFQVGEIASQPAIVQQPSSQAVCMNANAVFTVVATQATGYQWQVNTGSGWTNLGYNNTYFGANTAQLTINNAIAAMNGYQYRCRVYNSYDTVISNTASITVNSSVVPSVSIVASQGNVICSGTPVTFTASPINGGSSPIYQWQVNGLNVGSNSNTFSSSVLGNGDIITCILTSSISCVTIAAVTSNAITMVVNPTVTPTISIGVNPGTAICAGTLVTFTASAIAAGTTPVYQWKKNGNNVGTNSSSYADNTLNNSDVITCTLTSSAACATLTTVTSSSVTMVVNPVLTPVVTIVSNVGDTICSGTTVTYTATPVNGGTAPSYQWKKNGFNVGANSTTYIDNTIANGDIIACVMASNASCLSAGVDTSNTISMVVATSIVPDVTISVSPGNTVCANTSVTFTATPINGGNTPSFQWKLNGINVGGNSNTYTNTTLTNGDAVKCVMISSAGCASPSGDTSNIISMTVTPVVTPSVSFIISPNDTICSGTSVSFTATPVNGGSLPSYQWKRNGLNVGTNSNTYSDATPVNGNIYSCVMTTNAVCPSSTTASFDDTVVVIPVVTPSVSVTANPGNNICAGTSVTFTAIPTNGGASPSYQWKVNGSNVGTNSNTYSSTTLANTDIITCVMTSNAACFSTSTATSTGITMTVTPNVTPSVTISASPGNVICSGASVTFTASHTNGGSSPSYQWKVNGVNAATGTTYTTTSLSNNDVVTCVLTSSAACASPVSTTSNSITMTVNPYVTPSVSISANPGNTICSGTSVTFTATPTNGGSSPSYQWKVNGSNVGANSSSYTTSTLTNGDAVTCVLTTSASCITAANATSSAITMVVNPQVTPAVSISANPGNTICAGASVTFTANPVNGGASPSYQWKVNGSNVGTNSSTYTSATLINGDAVTCVLTSNATCVTNTIATSSAITMMVNAVLTASVAISSNPGNIICTGTSVTFTATPTNGGTTPAYQWKVNGLIVGINSPTYSSGSLTTGDIVTCDLTSNATCVSPATAISNGITMTVNPVLIPAVAVNVSPGTTVGPWATINFSANVTNGGTSPTYQWRKNGITIPGATNSTYSATTSSSLADNDIICVLIKSNATCVSPDTVSSCAPVINISLGVNGVEVVNDFKLYPNPNHGSFVIKGTVIHQAEVSIQILNTMGQVIYKSSVTSSGKEFYHKVDLPDISKGVYLLRLKQNGEYRDAQFVVE